MVKKKRIFIPIWLLWIVKAGHIFKTIRFARISRFYKEGCWIVLGQISAVIGTLFGVRLITELLDPAAYGELALSLAVATVINQTVLGPLSNGVTRFYAPAQEFSDLGNYLNAAYKLLLFATGVVILIALVALAVLLVTGRAEWQALTISSIVFATLSGYNVIFSGIQNAARQRAIVALHQGIEPWLRFGLAASFLFWLSATSTVAIAGYAAATLILLGSQFVFFQKLTLNNVNDLNVGKSWGNDILKYSWPFASWGLFSWALIVSDRWALEFFVSTREVGLYAVLFQLGYQPVSMATGMVVQLLSPILFQRAGDASDALRNVNVNNLSWMLFLLSLSMTGVLFLIALVFHENIFNIFAAKEYVSISYLLPWIMLAGGLFAAGQVMSLNLMSQMKTRDMVTVKIATSIFGIVFNFAGAYLFGVAGVVYAGVLFSLVYSVWMAVTSQNVVAKQ